MGACSYQAQVLKPAPVLMRSVEMASRVLGRVGSILEVYAGAADEFTVKHVFWIDDRGHIMQRLRTGYDPVSWRRLRFLRLAYRATHVGVGASPSSVNR